MRTTAAGIFVFNIPADFHKHLMSAFGGKADIEISGRDVLLTQSGHEPSGAMAHAPPML
jgi:hypothetical protein